MAELLEKNKNYILLKQIENIDKIKIIIREYYIKNKDSIISNFNLNKLFFFLVITIKKKNSIKFYYKIFLPFLKILFLIKSD